jgi:Zn ribbon nucleic-acid-binding protein
VKMSDCNHHWEADETGIRCCVHCGVTDERDRPSAMTAEAQRDALWQLLDNIDTLDDACREDDLSFRNLSRKHLLARFAIHNPEEGKR